MCKVNEIIAKSLIRKYKKADSWFVARYGFNIYRGCAHDCAYCDGRSEKYRVDGEFGSNIAVKINAPELFMKETAISRKHKPWKKGFFVIGGGVGDSYQPVEEKYQITRKLLEIIAQKGFPVHTITKSSLITRDIDILKKIHKKARAIVTFSFSSVDENTCSIFEPGLPSPKERLWAIKQLKKANIPCGVFLLPVIPFITDTPKMIENTITAVKEAGADYVLFGGMTLKAGARKTYFTDVLKKYYPGLVSQYENIYSDNQYGEASAQYYRSIEILFHRIAQQKEIPVRIAAKFFNKVTDQNDLVVILLEQLAYLMSVKGKKTSFGYAAYSISRLKQPIAELRNNLTAIKGIDNTSATVIKEIIETGRYRSIEL